MSGTVGYGVPRDRSAIILDSTLLYVVKAIQMNCARSGESVYIISR